MYLQPIQVLENAVLIPVEYLSNATEFEFERVNGHVLVRPKQNGDAKTRQSQTQASLSDEESDYLLPSESSRFSFVGIAETRNPYASEEVENILNEELGRRSEGA